MDNPLCKNFVDEFVDDDEKATVNFRIKILGDVAPLCTSEIVNRLRIRARDGANTCELLEFAVKLLPDTEENAAIWKQPSQYHSMIFKELFSAIFLISPVRLKHLGGWQGFATGSAPDEWINERYDPAIRSNQARWESLIKE